MSARRRQPRLSSTRTQRGMALLMVLLLSLVIGVLVIALLDDIRFGVQRTANAQGLAQARHFALGAEAMARRRVSVLGTPGVPVDTWRNAPLAFPIESGLIQTRLSDGSTCFNLNALAVGVPGQWNRNEAGVQQYVALLQTLGFAAAQAQGLADTTSDWIDTDNLRAPLGAEDASYAARGRGYRTAGTLLAEVSELRAMRGYTPNVYERIRPYVCALPLAGISPVNINALDEAQAPVLSMLTLGQLPLAQARQVIRTRPAQGWSDTDFAAALQARGAELADYDQYRTAPTWFVLDVDVDYAGNQVTLNSLLHYNGMGDARLAARRWTRDE